MLIDTNIAEEIKSILCIFGGHYLDIKLNGQFENSQHMQHICLKQAAILHMNIKEKGNTLTAFPVNICFQCLPPMRYIH